MMEAVKIKYVTKIENLRESFIFGISNYITFTKEELKENLSTLIWRADFCIWWWLEYGNPYIEQVNRLRKFLEITLKVIYSYIDEIPTTRASVKIKEELRLMYIHFLTSSIGHTVKYGANYLTSRFI